MNILDFNQEYLSVSTKHDILDSNPECLGVSNKRIYWISTKNTWV